MRKLAIALFIGTVLAAQLGAQTIVQSNQYQVTPGTGLNVNVGTGRVNCAGTETTYSGGTLSLGAWATDYVYLNTASGCVPAVKTSAFACGDIPLATVVTALSSLITITDARTSYGYPCAIGCSGVTAGSYTNANITVNSAGCVTAAENGSGGSGGSTQVIYASLISGAHPGVAVAAGSSATGTTDSASAINTAIASGNIDLEVDSGFALSSSLVLHANTTIHCTSPQYGFIMQASSNKAVVVNANQNAPTTSSGTGGYLVSNQTDNNIKVIGCVLNANATQSVTGSGNASSTAHTTDPSTGYAVYGVFFNAVAGIGLFNNEIYDSGEYSVLIANSSNVAADGNYVHQPLSSGWPVQYKNTDGIDIIGPANNVEISRNVINSGDDSITIAAEGCQRNGESDCQQPGLKWGPIQHVHIEDNTLQNSDYGIRLLDGSELIDDVDIGDTQGNVCGNSLTMVEVWSTYGYGNLGRVNVHGWKVPTSGTCNNYSQPYNFELGLIAQDIEIGDVQYANPAVTWPILTVLGSMGTIQTLNLHGWDVTTASSTFTYLVDTNGAVNHLIADNFVWNDTVGTGHPFGGSVAPTTFTCSNYAGFLGVGTFGYSTTENGDCFQPITTSGNWPPSAAAPVFSPSAGTVASGTTVTASCAGSATPWVSLGTTPVAGGTGVTLSTSQTVYGSCQGSGYIVNGVAAYTIAGGFTVVNNGYENGTGTAISSADLSAFSSALTAGSIIVVHEYAGANPSSFPVPTDTAGNTYVDCGPGKVTWNGGADAMECFYALNTYTTSSNVVHISASSSASYLNAMAVEIRGAAGSSPIDGGSGVGYSYLSNGTGGSAGANNLVGASITPAGSGDLIIGMFSGSSSAPTNGTSPNAFVNVNGAANGMVETYYQATSAAITATASDATGSDGYAAIVIAVKP